MQDKDFDKLFKHSLHDVEIEPSADLWSAIETQITPKKKVLKLRYWLIAASMVLSATVTLVIFREQQLKTETNFTTASRAIKKAEVATKESPKVIEPKIIQTHIDEAVIVGSKPTKFAVKRESKKNDVEFAPKILIQKIDGQAQIIENRDLPKTDTQPLEPIVLATANKPVEDEIEFAAIEVLPKENIPAEEKTTTPSVKNAGDLINLVVGVVDKSKRKFIKFKTSDEGSTLAAVNIGPFRFGKGSD